MLQQVNPIICHGGNGDGDGDGDGHGDGDGDGDGDLNDNFALIIFLISWRLIISDNR